MNKREPISFALIQLESMADNSKDGPDSPLPHNIWSRFMFGVGRRAGKTSKSGEDEALILSAVERQTENSRKGGTIWEAVRKADEASFKSLLTENPKNVESRGPVGECPIHMLFLYGTDTHLNMARYLITNFPHTITQIYNLPVKIRFSRDEKIHR